MNKRDKTSRDIYFVLFILGSFPTSFDLRSSSRKKCLVEKIFFHFKELIYCQRSDGKCTGFIVE